MHNRVSRRRAVARGVALLTALALPLSWQAQPATAQSGDMPGDMPSSTQPQKPSEINAQLPTEIDALILSCLEKHMDKRVASADDLRSRIKPLKKLFA